MAALLKEYGLCSGDGMRQTPGRARSDVHIVTAVDHERGKFKAGEFRREVEIGGCFLHGVADGRLKSKIAHVAHIGVAFFRRVKDHAEMVAQAGAGRGFRCGSQLLCFLRPLFLNIGKDIGQQVDNVMP